MGFDFVAKSRQLSLIAIASLISAFADARPLVMATGTMPGGRANPHDSISMTRAWLYAAVYDTLTFVDRDGQVIPWLATSWRRDSDRAWRFDLRPGVTFSDGAPLTARSIAANIGYLNSDAGKIEPAAPFVYTIDAVDVIDDHTFVLRTHNPDPVLPQKLSLIRIAAVADGEAMSRERLAQAGIGSGPYRIESWSPGRATLVAVPGAWRRAPTAQLDAVSIPESTSRRAAIASGVADVAFAAFFFEDLDDPNLPYRLELDQIPAVIGLAYNTKKDTPLRDSRVRRALSHAVDVNGIIKALFAGRAVRAAQIARKESFGFNPDLNPAAYDPARAQALLAEAGYPYGFALAMTLTSGATVWDQVFQLIAADFAKIKVRLTINMLPEPVMSEQLFISGVKDDAYAAVYFSPTFDALEAFRLSTCAWPASVYCDPPTQDLIDRAAAAVDTDDRAALTRQALARSAEAAQALMLYESIGLVGYNKRIRNFRSDFGFPRYELMVVDE